MAVEDFDFDTLEVRGEAECSRDLDSQDLDQRTPRISMSAS